MLSLSEILSLQLMKAPQREILTFIQGHEDGKLQGYCCTSSYEAAEAKAYEILQECKDKGIQVVSWGSKDYPPGFTCGEDAPLVLYYKGCLPSGDSVAVVGTRMPTAWGVEVSKRCAQFFADRGWNIVSGLAKGVDHKAHALCVDKKKPTTAVLACGLDLVSDKGLAERILKEGGCLISEHPPGVKAQRHFFPRRNRIQVALSKAVFVIQCGVHSGTMHAVSYALKYNKPVYAFSPSGRYASEKESNGNQALIKIPGKDLVEKISWDRKMKVPLYDMEGPVAIKLTSRSDMEIAEQELSLS